MTTKDDWNTEPFPLQREDLGYHGFFRDADAEKIMAGHTPTSMDDKWFIYSEDSWVYFVRSWSGHHIFALQLSGSPAGGASVVSSWVNTDPSEYRSQGRQMDIRVVDTVIKVVFGVDGRA